MKKLISIVTPVYNEEETLDLYFNELITQTKKLNEYYNFELILVDNNSTDNTYEILKKYKNKIDFLKIYKLTKNFGYQKSLWTGITLSKGDVCITLDADLQDPTDMIEKFLEKWEEGYKIVYGVRVKREENFIISAFRKIFYKLINKLSENNLPQNAGDFMLIDKKIINLLKNLNEHDIYLRGLIFSFGFKRIGIDYNRKNRNRGESKFKLLNLISFAINSFFNEGIFPLRLATIFGISLFFISIILFVFYFFTKIFNILIFPPGYATLLLILLISTALNGIFLGIIGEYIARIQRKTRNIPITIIEEKDEN
tara:strand:- start:367 stop:1302 length:936 start_codon:yes stop_codon:yes gene_type:complete